jgi:hypothetical protein
MSSSSSAFLLQGPQGPPNILAAGGTQTPPQLSTWRQTVVSQETVCLSRSDYDQLLNQKILIMTQLVQQTEQNLRCHVACSQKDMEIAELERANDGYHQRLPALEVHIASVDASIAKLDLERTEISEVDNKSLDEQIAQLFGICSDLRAVSEFKRLRSVIQDLNEHFILESTINGLQPILNECKETCRFLVDGERSDIRDYKLFIILEHLEKISAPCRNIFDIRFTGTVDAIITTLRSVKPTDPLTLTRLEKEGLEAWFQSL